MLISHVVADSAEVVVAREAHIESRGEEIELRLMQLVRVFNPVHFQQWADSGGSD